MKASKNQLPLRNLYEHLALMALMSVLLIISLFRDAAAQEQGWINSDSIFRNSPLTIIRLEAYHLQHQNFKLVTKMDVAFPDEQVSVAAGKKVNRLAISPINIGGNQVRGHGMDSFTARDSTVKPRKNTQGRAPVIGSIVGAVIGLAIAWKGNFPFGTGDLGTGLQIGSMAGMAAESAITQGLKQDK